MSTSYHTFDVLYEYKDDGGETTHTSRATVRCYGDSEFAVVAALKKERPHHTDVVPLEISARD